MLSTLVVVDGTNLYADAARCLEAAVPVKDDASRELRRAYFVKWFDADRLISATLADHSRLLDQQVGMGTVIFHSLAALGDKENGSLILGPEHVAAFWARQGSAASTSTILVNVVGAPKGKKEVGVDTSIVVHLFETMEHWDAAVLFTSDSDLVPAVWALRRRGKRVYCSSPTSPQERPSVPLIQASQSFFQWDLNFLKADYVTFEMLQPGGVLDELLATPGSYSLRSISWHKRLGGVVLERGLPPQERGGENQLGFVVEAVQPLFPPQIKVEGNVQTDCLQLTTAIGRGATFFGMHRHAEDFRDAAWFKLWSGRQG